MISTTRCLVATFFTIILSLSSVRAIAVAINRDDIVVRDAQPQENATPLETRSDGKVGLVWSNGEDDHLHQYVTSKTHLYDYFTPFFPST